MVCGRKALRDPIPWLNNTCERTCTHESSNIACKLLKYLKMYPQNLPITCTCTCWLCVQSCVCQFCIYLVCLPLVNSESNRDIAQHRHLKFPHTVEALMSISSTEKLHCIEHWQCPFSCTRMCDEHALPEVSGCHVGITSHLPIDSLWTLTSTQRISYWLTSPLLFDLPDPLQLAFPWGPASLPGWPYSRSSDLI